MYTNQSISQNGNHFTPAHDIYQKGFHIFPPVYCVVVVVVAVDKLILGFHAQNALSRVLHFIEPNSVWHTQEIRLPARSVMFQGNEHIIFEGKICVFFFYIFQQSLQNDANNLASKREPPVYDVYKFEYSDTNVA